MEKICVIGTGYVGLILGVCLANKGVEIVCADVDESKIKLLSSGTPTIYENGLDIALKKAIASGKISFTTNTNSAIMDSGIIYIAVGTPQRADGSADLSGIEAAAKEIGLAMNDYKIIVNKSTVPTGTTILVRKIIEGELKKRIEAGELKNEIEFGVVSHPEFLAEGNAIMDFEEERIIIGAEKEKDANRIKQIYETAFGGKKQILLTDPKSAELIKYASNSMLALRISFMNELSHVCEKEGADITAVAQGMGLDGRIGNKFLSAGGGYGGSCFPKDIRALSKIMEKNNCEARIVNAIDYVNEAQKNSLILRLKKMVPELKGKKIAVLGLTFKANTDDIRESPAITLIQAILNEGGNVVAFDPKGMENTKKVLRGNGMSYAKNALEAMSGASAVAVITEWKEFKEIDWSKAKPLLLEPNCLDARNLYNPAEMKKLGFNYLSIGRN